MNNSLIGKIKRFRKLKFHLWKTKNGCKYKIFMEFHSHIKIFNSVVHKSLLITNEEKLVALLVYYSFIRVANSCFRITPYSLGVVFVCRNEEKLETILLYYSFIRVANSCFRITPYSLGVVFVFRKERN